MHTSRTKQETDGSPRSTAPPGAQTALCGLLFRKARQILLRLRQKTANRSEGTQVMDCLKKRGDTTGIPRRDERVMQVMQV